VFKVFAFLVPFCNYPLSFVFSFLTTMYTWLAKITKVFFGLVTWLAYEKKFVLQDNWDSLLKRKTSMYKCHEYKPILAIFFFCFFLSCYNPISFQFFSFLLGTPPITWFALSFLIWSVHIQLHSWLHFSFSFIFFVMLLTYPNFIPLFIIQLIIPSWHIHLLHPSVIWVT